MGLCAVVLVPLLGLLLDEKQQSRPISGNPLQLGEKRPGL